MNAGWIIPFIIFGGALQSCGAAMNGQLNKSLGNPWLASAVSFALITFFFTHASPAVDIEGSRRDALVGYGRRSGRGGPGLCRSQICE
jgi:uncharacterized membrane protein YdcZ (DUF606 family)